MRSLWLMMVVVGGLGLVACSGDDKDDDDDEDGAGGGAGSEVSGSFTLADGETVTLVGGGAYNDTSEGGALQVFLTDFPTDCAAVADGLGFNAASGGVYLAFYSELDDPFSAGVYVHDGGYQVNLEETLDFTVDISSETPMTEGSIELADGRGSATFSVEHCGDVEPFFR